MFGWLDVHQSELQKGRLAHVLISRRAFILPCMGMYMCSFHWSFYGDVHPLRMPILSAKARGPFIGFGTPEILKCISQPP